MLPRPTRRPLAAAALPPAPTPTRPHAPTLPPTPQAEIPEQGAMRICGVDGFVPYRAPATLLASALSPPPSMEEVAALRTPELDRYLPPRRHRAAWQSRARIQLDFCHFPIVDLSIPEADGWVVDVRGWVGGAAVLGVRGTGLVATVAAVARLSRPCTRLQLVSLLLAATAKMPHARACVRAAPAGCGCCWQSCPRGWSAASACMCTGESGGEGSGQRSLAVCCRRLPGACMPRGGAHEQRRKQPPRSTTGRLPQPRTPLPLATTADPVPGYAASPPPMQLGRAGAGGPGGRHPAGPAVWAVGG